MSEEYPSDITLKIPTSRLVVLAGVKFLVRKMPIVQKSPATLKMSSRSLMQCY